jgi:hypothetical protein
LECRLAKSLATRSVCVCVCVYMYVCVSWRKGMGDHDRLSICVMGTRLPDWMRWHSTLMHVLHAAHVPKDDWRAALRAEVRASLSDIKLEWASDRELARRRTSLLKVACGWADEGGVRCRCGVSSGLGRHTTGSHR